MERGRKMIENSYKTPCGCIHYFVNIMDKQRITLVFLPGLTADHRLFENQIRKAIDALKQAKQGLKIEIPIDIIAVSLKESIEDLSEITGENVSEDIINNIFSKFCLGK